MYVVSNNLHDWFTPSNPDIGCKRISERKERGLGRSRNLTLSDDAPARYQYRSTVVIASCHWFAAAADDDDAGHSQPVLKGTGLRCCGVDGVMGSCLRARSVHRSVGPLAKFALSNSGGYLEGEISAR